MANDSNLMGRLRNVGRKYLIVPALALPIYFGIGCGGDKDSITGDVTDGGNVIKELPPNNYKLADGRIAEIVLIEAGNEQNLGAKYDGQQKSAKFKPLGIPTSVVDGGLKYDITGTNNAPDGAVEKSDFNLWIKQNPNPRLEDVLAFLEQFGMQTAVLGGSAIDSGIEKQGTGLYRNNTAFGLEGIDAIALNVEKPLRQNFNYGKEDIREGADGKYLIFQNDAFNGEQVRVLGEIKGDNGNGYRVVLSPVDIKVAEQYLNTVLPSDKKVVFNLTDVPDILSIYVIMDKQNKLEITAGYKFGRINTGIGHDERTHFYVDDKIIIDRDDYTKEELTRWVGAPLIGQKTIAFQIQNVASILKVAISNYANLKIN